MAAPPRTAASAPETSAHPTTRVTSTDYGYVIGELRRLAILTVAILTLLLVIWLLVA